ncbi:uncharacterized protein SAPINGB_P005471 [Magnusiomyces paraingens]|uniref:Enoyl reductase (ER) domain-containing protein n=1 Tax=Magnusiomyces paraingens TaxID=2606893 RepID=A0A5E8BZV6_9ASCO|nr:uncharacterized protein SAPINGB_P005471 [Saprochaete ingens]VVT56984.1 unnamed protein product [Saprochaete ingens]
MTPIHPEIPKTMAAVVFNGPHNISLETKPVPALSSPGSVLLRVNYTALCGSELHVFRGHQPSPTGFIMGHEFTGVVVRAGADVRTLAVGDKVVSPFTISCGNNCFYCKHGASSRCTKSRLFGTAALDGGQAEYVDVPLADATLVKQPHLKPGVDPVSAEKKLVLMADIFPTGYFAAKNAFKEAYFTQPGYNRPDTPPSTDSETSRFVALVVGCGPVGLCAIAAAKHLLPPDAILYAIDSVPARLELAKSLGAIALPLDQDPVATIKKATEGRGADAVMEIVGHASALRLAFDAVRPWGRIASVGVHNEDIPITGNEAYGKNITIQFGRCPVRSIFDDALKVFVQVMDQLDFLTGTVVKLADAKEAYDLFDQHKVEKIIFEI